MRTQWLSSVSISDLSLKRLRALMQYSYDNVPYYHRIFKERNLTSSDIKSVKDLHKLPRLTKKIVKDNFDKMISSNFPKSDLVPWSTGGSTGVPLKFMQDRESLRWIDTAMLRSFCWAGYRRFNKLVTVWGFPEKPSPLKPWQRHLTISTFGVGDRQIMHYLELIRKFKPKGIRGYASSLYVLAKQASGIKLDFAISSSEVLFDRYRKLIEEKFECDVFDNYSSREFMVASECKEHAGYHVAAENVMVEFVRDNEHVAPGERGEILVTDLTKYGMPLIRYETGDLGKSSDEVCPCGRGLPLIKCIEGRVTDIISTPRGKFISSPAVTLIFRNLEVDKFQIVQKTKEKLVIKIVKGPRYSHIDTEYVLDQFRKYIEEDMEVEVEFVKRIPLTKSGKLRVVVSLVNHS